MNNFTDKDLLFDLLFTEKSLSSIYNTGVNESTGQVRQVLIEIWHNVHDQQKALFDVLHEKGDYPTSMANIEKIIETKNKFCHCGC